jgi:hypothetical protein
MENINLILLTVKWQKIGFTLDIRNLTFQLIAQTNKIQQCIYTVNVTINTWNSDQEQITNLEQYCPDTDFTSMHKQNIESVSDNFFTCKQLLDLKHELAGRLKTYCNIT